jgi:hypothetical protein
MPGQKLLIALFLGVFLLVPGMFASTVTQTCTPTVSTTTPISYTEDCTIAAFNTALGTLTGVTLQLTGVGGEAIPTQYNNNAAALSFDTSVTTISMSYEELFSSTVLVQVQQASNPCSGEAMPGANTWCTPTDFSALSSAVLPDTNLSYYETGGTVTLAGLGAAVDSSGNGDSSYIYFGGAGAIGGQLTVTYNYTTPDDSAPEPATMALLGGGLIGLAAIIRKRRA